MKLPMINVSGEYHNPHLELIALSTCGFCKKAMTYLSERKFAFSYIFLDELEPEVKAEYKTYFHEKFFQPLSYPTLIMDDLDVIVGFIPSSWDEKVVPQ